MLLRQLVTAWLHSQATSAARDTVLKGVHSQAVGQSEPAPDSPETPPLCDVGLVFALAIEAGGLLDRMQGVVRISGSTFTAHRGRFQGRNIVLIESGAGREKAAHATAALIDGHDPAWVISAGFAGGLTDATKRNDILIADRIALPEGHQLNIDLHMPPQSNLHVGRLLTVDAVIHSAEEKRRLAENHAALAVDMESYAVAEVCAQRKTRCFSVRVISDAVEDELPREVEHLLHQKTLSGKLGAVTGSLFRRPSSIKDLWALKERAVMSSDKLALFLAGVIEQLPAHAPLPESAASQKPESAAANQTPEPPPAE